MFTYLIDRIMVALRRFQEIMRMLACQSPATQNINSPSSTVTTNKSTQTPIFQRSLMKNSKTFVSTPNQQRRRSRNSPILSNHNKGENRLSEQIKRKGRDSYGNNQYREIYSSDEILSHKQYRNINSPLMTNYATRRNICSQNNRNRIISPVTPLRYNNNDTNYMKSANKKSFDYNNNSNSNRNNPSLKTIRRNFTIKTPPAKDHKFSRYTPLPAINSSDNNVETDSSKSHHQDRRLVRQLTYKVLNPLFVKGPLDIRNNVNLETPNKNINDKPSSRCSTPSSQTMKRSKTIVIKNNKNKTMKDRSNYGKDRNEVEVKTKSLSYPITMIDRMSPKKELKEKNIKNIREKQRLEVKRKLIEAADRIKEGKPMVDTAFWVEF